MWPISPTGMPSDALPQSIRKGKLSYTVTSPHTGAKVEVHLKGKAFRIIKVGTKDGCLVSTNLEFYSLGQPSERDLERDFEIDFFGAGGILCKRCVPHVGMVLIKFPPH